MQPDLRKISKFLSYTLRHNPQKLGLELEDAGWVEVDKLIDQAIKYGIPLSRPIIKEVINSSDKKRFALSEDEQHIRATYGHSIPVKLGYKPQLPPEELYHGTAVRNLSSIQKHGLQPQNRQYVHLSGDPQSAKSVGQRHGTPAVLLIQAGQMAKENHTFFKSDTGIWLTIQVPPSYINFPD